MAPKKGRASSPAAKNNKKPAAAKSKSQQSRTGRATARTTVETEPAVCPEQENAQDKTTKKTFGYVTDEGMRKLFSGEPQRFGPAPGASAMVPAESAAAHTDAMATTRESKVSEGDIAPASTGHEPGQPSAAASSKNASVDQPRDVVPKDTDGSAASAAHKGADESTSCADGDMQQHLGEHGEQSGSNHAESTDSIEEELARALSAPEESCVPAVPAHDDVVWKIKVRQLPSSPATVRKPQVWNTPLRIITSRWQCMKCSKHGYAVSHS